MLKWIFPAKINHLAYTDILQLAPVKKRIDSQQSVHATYHPVSDLLSGEAKLIHVMNESDEHCLIAGSVMARDEEDVILTLYEKSAFHTPIIVYGKNATHVGQVMKKAEKLFFDMGFSNVSVYLGGMFEWLLLAQTYGFDNFPCFIVQGMAEEDSVGSGVTAGIRTFNYQKTLDYGRKCGCRDDENA